MIPLSGYPLSVMIEVRIGLEIKITLSPEKALPKLPIKRTLDVKFDFALESPYD